MKNNAGQGRCSTDAESEMMESHEVTDIECDELRPGAITGSVAPYESDEGDLQLRNSVRAIEHIRPIAHLQWTGSDHS